MGFERIADPDDPRVADYAGLRDPARRSRVEREGAFFVAESPLVVQRLLASGRRVRSVLVTADRYDALAGALATCPAPVFVAPEGVLRAVVGFDLHRGVVAAADRWPLPTLAAVLSGARLVAVVERLNDHENLGVVFRNAAAFGIDAVLLDPECADPLYRRCVRVSIGHVLTVPWTRATPAEVQAAGFALVALTPDAGATPIDEVAWPPRCALALGAEGPGLRPATLARADLCARIPMASGVDSLNVATAAGIAFHVASARMRR